MIRNICYLHFVVVCGDEILFIKFRLFVWWCTLSISLCVQAFESVYRCFGKNSCVYVIAVCLIEWPRPRSRQSVRRGKKTEISSFCPQQQFIQIFCCCSLTLWFKELLPLPTLLWFSFLFAYCLYGYFFHYRCSICVRPVEFFVPFCNFHSKVRFH